MLLIIFYISLLGAKWQLRFMTFIGVVLIFELWHIVGALRTMSYYPGMITAFLFPILGFFFWKELLYHKRLNVD
ncbi:HXXEE domain-containing protein [Patescibacteria group bacterium]|nr:HXXEE domain-containing protein [Patescibacteria group bacterium]